MAYYRRRRKSSYGRYPRYRRRRTWGRRRHYARRGHRNYRWRSRHSTTQVRKDAIPRKRKLITVRGWEPLGVVGSQYLIDGTGKLGSRWTITNNRPSTGLKWFLNGDKDKPNKDSSIVENFLGGWGTGTFSLQSLVQRAKRGLARFSDPFEGYERYRFCGGKAYLVPANEVDYLFRTDDTLDYKDEDQDCEKRWVHPAIMLTMPGRKLVESIKRTKCCKWKKIRIPHSPHIGNTFADIADSKDWILWSYQWSSIDLNNPLGPRSLNKDHISTGGCGEGPKMQFWNDWLWMGAPYWADRFKWDENFMAYMPARDCNSDTQKAFIWPMMPNDRDSGFECQKNSNSIGCPRWSPFCPPVYPTQNGPNGLFFLYYVKFVVAGKTINPIDPGYPAREVLCPPVETCPPLPNKKSKKKAAQEQASFSSGESSSSLSQDSAEIRPEDVDSDGLLTEPALRRITQPHNQQRLLKLLRKTVRKFKAGALKSQHRRKRVRFADHHKLQQQQFGG